MSNIINVIKVFVVIIMIMFVVGLLFLLVTAEDHSKKCYNQRLWQVHKKRTFNVMYFYVRYIGDNPIIGIIKNKTQWSKIPQCYNDCYNVNL